MPEHAQKNNMTKPVVMGNWFEVGDLVSTYPGTPPHDTLTEVKGPISGTLACVPLGIILKAYTQLEEGAGILWCRLDVQWFSPKKIKMTKVRSFYLEKILSREEKNNE